MKIAVIADVHGNARSLEAVLADIDTEKPDHIVGAGDMVGCSAYPGAPAVWRALQESRIPCVLGNEEERILNFHSPALDPLLTASVQFLPLRFRACQFSPAELEALRALPTTLLVEGPRSQDVLICHASPASLHRSPMQGIDSQMDSELSQVQASVIALGHFHTPWLARWRGKLLVMAGSAGLPLRGELGIVEYLLLTHANGHWQPRYKTVHYDHESALSEVLACGFLEQSGPIGWLMFAEILTQSDHLTPFLRDFCPPEKPSDFEGWKRLVIAYLQSVSRWEAVEPHLRRLL